MSKTDKDQPYQRQGRKERDFEQDYMSREFGKRMERVGTETIVYPAGDGFPRLKLVFDVYKPVVRLNRRTAKAKALRDERDAELGTHDFGSIPGFPELMTPVIEFQERRTNKRHQITIPRTNKAKEAKMNRRPTRNIVATVRDHGPAKWNEPEARPLPLVRSPHGSTAKMPARVKDTDAITVIALAKEAGVATATVLSILKDMGEYAKPRTKVASIVANDVRCLLGVA